MLWPQNVLRCAAPPYVLLVPATPLASLSHLISLVQFVPYQPRQTHLISLEAPSFLETNAFSMFDKQLVTRRLIVGYEKSYPRLSNTIPLLH